MDHNELEEVKNQIYQVREDLRKMEIDVGNAKQFIKLADTERKRILARHMAPILKVEKSAPRAEVLAMANPDYVQDMDEFREKLAHSYSIDHRASRRFAALDSLRSLLSYGKRTMDII